LAVFSLEASIAVNQPIAALEFLQLCAKPKDGEAEYLSGSGSLIRLEVVQRLVSYALLSIVVSNRHSGEVAPQNISERAESALMTSA
jgi:hypothetical protein